MKTLLIRLPDSVYDALQARSESINTSICVLLAESLGIDYTPPSRGGRRLPRELTTDELNQVKRLMQQGKHLLSVDDDGKPLLFEGASPTLPEPIIREATVHGLPPALPSVKSLMTPARATLPPLSPHNTLSAEGYPFAEVFKANNRYTGKLLKAPPEQARAGCRYENIGNTTLAEFEKVCGRPATFE